MHIYMSDFHQNLLKNFGNHYGQKINKPHQKSGDYFFSYLKFMTRFKMPLALISHDKPLAVFSGFESYF
jgi:hypothetical protein